MKKSGFLIGMASILLAGVIFYALTQETEIDFSTQVKPILNQHCISCHGGVKKNGGFSLLFEEEALAATESGRPAIIPGDVHDSEFISRLSESDPEVRMPYKKAPLSEEEIKILTQWVEEGANWGQHWAYKTPAKPVAPEKGLQAGLLSEEAPPFIQNDIDRFIAEGLARQELSPSSEAGKNILIRRLSLDLTGLPPDEALVSRWKSGQMSYEELVDELLDNPAFGEKWASWWLDLARYADTKGYERDVSRQIWAYRDWVIKALNADMPFDQFTIEQLAGDLLPDPDLDQLTATAFHRNTMNNDEGGTQDEEFRVTAVIDRVNTTFEVWQSTTMSCVQCHSHPYDPFRHEDYYQLMAFFNNSRDEDTHGEEPKLKFYTGEDSIRMEEIKSWAAQYGNETLENKMEAILLYQEPKYHAHIAEDFENGELIDTKWLGLWDNGSCYLRDVYTGGSPYIYINYWTGNEGNLLTIRKGGPEGEILAQFTLGKTEGRVIRRFPIKELHEKVDLYLHMENKSLKPQQTTSTINWFGFFPELPGQDQPGHEEIDHDFLTLLNKNTPSVPILVENPDYMKRETHVFERGNWMLKGEAVKPDVPAVLNSWDPEWPENRLGLAYWLTSKENPLTARTLANRLWEQLFGRGIVSTLEDMGTQSDPPSHRQLLDWLAVRLMEDHNWRLKPLIKDMVLSGTYRQSSVSSAFLHEKDPENKWYARGPRFRLSAEQIRDQALAASGLLSRKMYGKPVMPPQPDNVWQTVYNGESWETSEGEDRYRRAVYTFLKRTSPYPSFISFDAGSREVCTISRTVTNTPLQALVTLNDPVYQEAAFHLALSMYRSDAADPISWAYERLLLQPISPQKQEHLQSLYAFALEDFSSNTEAMEEWLQFAEDEQKNPELAALALIANALMNLDEFLTKS
ncbi:PSD1 and planctomycete cytochrome C domain-containing protein [Cyclobacterium jeungdonense]|uniref:PSD1 and planctomycete cytochrome C domain-containing protein n=1 Tax=Cyclobacterium jeungdonense TaxID=708087 RepID=A0ABT8C3R9_9BACT|nr:PSD1 and planctomycete cytochrome C domain-containing protein [Cyclobacterium jeungdonense]MDN3687017.1 PSD1 and planctomycete cytochrome C domain-containing protein [Cyclobacterium jeungdonense]